MSYFSRNAVILAKLEVAYNTDANPAGANAILVRNLSMTPQNAEFASRDLIRPYYGNSESLPTAISAICEFEIELAGSGTAGDVPAWGDLLRACGFAETVDAGTSVVYAPVSTGFDSLSMLYSVGGDGGSRIRHKFNGARGTVSFEAKNKAIPVMKFRFQGTYSAVVDDATALAPDFSAFVAPLPVNRVNTPGFTLHGAASAMSELTLDVANTLVFRSLPGSAAEQVLITDRKPTGSITFEATSVATKNWWEIARTAATGALSLIHGVSAGNIIEIDAPSVQVNNPQYADDSGVAMLKCGLVPVPGSAGNDELSITVR